MNTLRSLSRYTALVLGGEWTVGFAADEAGGFSRPWARVSAATSITSVPHGTSHRDLRQTISIVAFPTPGLNPESSLVEASRVEGLLLDGFTMGIDPVGFSRRSRRGHPLRVPAFDYSELGLYEPAGEEHRAGWLRVLDPPALASFPDPNDDDLYIVTCDLRLGWSEGILRPPAPPVEEVHFNAAELP